LRIDFILADKKFRINEHKNFNIELSDHEPVSARLSY
jgi:endonuclease/exonuclease/phosphatase family metal-dependent hydrolase